MHSSSWPSTIDARITVAVNIDALIAVLIQLNHHRCDLTQPSPIAHRPLPLMSTIDALIAVLSPSAMPSMHSLPLPSTINALHIPLPSPLTIDYLYNAHN
jgi:hypothetical protein